MTQDLRSLLAPWRAQASRSALLFDFDGTLSPVVDEPAAARPGPGVADALGALVGPYLRVGVVSGRPLSFLTEHVPAGVELSGLYGLEWTVDGEAVTHPDSVTWRPMVTEAIARTEAAAAPGGDAEGMKVEAKGLSITLHVRTRPELVDAARRVAEETAAATGLEVRTAKMSFELHPPIPADKGTALRELAAGAERVLYAGDDVGDVPAYDALATLGPGVSTLAVAVDSEELPEAVRSRAQLLLPDQAAVLDLLHALRP